MSTLKSTRPLELFDRERVDTTLPSLPPVGKLQRLFADTRTHRVLPRAAAEAACRARVALQWRGGPPAPAMEATEFLLGRSALAGDLERHAREYAHETVRRAEYLWRPWEMSRIPVEGTGYLHAALAQGGALMHFLHHGPYVGLPLAVQQVGVTLRAPIAPFYFGDPSPGYSGHRDRQHMRTLASGGRMFNALGSRRAIDELVAAGELVAIASDIPGRDPVEFLGRRVGATGGLVRLAMATGAPILPVTMHREPGRLARLRFHPPVLPGDFDDVDTLLQRLLDVHAPAILDWPGAFEWPLQRFARLEDDAA